MSWCEALIRCVLGVRRHRLIRSFEESRLLLVLSYFLLGFLKLVVGDLVEPLLHQDRIARHGEGSVVFDDREERRDSCSCVLEIRFSDVRDEELDGIESVVASFGGGGL